MADVKITLELTLTMNADAWESTHNGSWKLNQATALAYVMQMFETDARCVGIIQVDALETTDPETGENIDEDGTCATCGDSLDEDDEGTVTCPSGCERV